MYAGATKTPGTGTACLYLPGTSGSSVRLSHNTRNFWKFCNTFIPVPGTSGSSVRQSYPYLELLDDLYVLRHNTRGYGYSMFCARPELLQVLYACATIPGTSGSFVTLSYLYPELLEVLYDIHTRTWKFCKFCTSFATIPGVRVQHVLYPTGTSGSSVRLCHNTRNFWKLCNTSIPVPETSGSSVRPPYPYPESTKPTEHDLGSFSVVS